MAQRPYAGTIHAFAALTVDIAFQVTGHRRDNLHTIGGEKRRQCLFARFVEYGQVAAIDDLYTHAAGGFHQVTEMRVELGSPAGDIEHRQLRGAQKIDNRLDGLELHLFPACRSGVDMTVQTSLVTTVAEIDLQCPQWQPPEGREIRIFQKWKCCVHRLAIPVNQ